MRKFLVLMLLMLIVLSSVFSVEEKFTKVKSSVKLTVTVQNVVYLGVANKAITSFVLPGEADRISEIGFTFDQYSNEWVTSSAYIYAISFVNKYVTISLSPATMDAVGDINSHLAYTLNVTSMVSSAACNSLSNISSSSLSTDGYTLCSESSKNTATTKPRVMCWEFQMKIPSSEVSTAAYVDYEAAFKLNITANN